MRNNELMSTADCDGERDVIRVSAGEPGFCKSTANVYAGYLTEIINSRASGQVHGRACRVLLSSHFEAFDPDWLHAEGVCRLLTVAEECEPPESIRPLFAEGKMR